MATREALQAHGLACLDAALAPEHWTALLADAATSVGAVGMDIHLLRGGAPWVSYMGVQPAEVLQEYTERFINREPRSLMLQHLRPGHVVTDLDFVDRETLRTLDYYADFLRRNDMGHCLAATPLRKGGDQAYLGVHFAFGREPPGPAQKAAVQALLPYLARALAVQYRLADAELRTSLYSEALDRLATGVVVLDGACRLMVANAAAHAALDDAACFRVRGGRMLAVCSQESARLELLCKAAVARCGEAGGAMLLRGTLVTPRYSLLVHPAATALRDRCGAAAFILFARLDGAPTADGGRLLRALFGLTPAEARLADALLHGETLQSAAERLAVTYETARFTLRQVYGKVGVNKQSQLVALLGAATLAWRRTSNQENPGESSSI